MMRKLWVQVIVVLWGLIPALAVAADDEWIGQWHQFRGPLATGEAPGATPPIEWSESSNVRWKVELPGVGSSTPIIWGDKLFVLTSVETDRVSEERAEPIPLQGNPFGISLPNKYHQFKVICLQRDSGQMLWEQTATVRVPVEGTHADNDFASSSPTTDGERLYVPFGSQGYYCYDLDGNPVWERDLGEVSTRLSFGEGASLSVHGDALIIVRDQDGPSEIEVLNAKTGETRWTRERDEPTAWATPIVVEHDGITQVVTNASNRVRSYDLESGDLVWECSGQVSNVTPSPVLFKESVVCMSGYRGSAAQAISLDSHGDVSESDSVQWSLGRATPYIASPVLYQGRLYFNQSLNGILSCVDAESGEVLYGPSRVDELRALYASPVAANGHIYVTGRDGTTVVFAADADEFEPVAVNTLDDPVDASAAIVGDAIFIRGLNYLYCIGE